MARLTRFGRMSMLLAALPSVHPRFVFAARMRQTNILHRHRTRCVYGGEIRVPREVREFMPSWTEPTELGDPRCAVRQYRYGNLHIREYADHYTVHTDRVDPRRDPVGHLLYDAPEVLVATAVGITTGTLTYFKACAAGHGRLAAAATAAAGAISAGGLAYGWFKRSKARQLDSDAPASGYLS